MRIALSGGCLLLGVLLGGCSDFDSLDRCSREPCATDAAPPEGGTHDAAADAGHFCAALSPRPIYCCDFDEESFDCPGGNTIPVHDAGVVAVVLDASPPPPSPPGSLLIQSPPLSGTSDDRTALCVDFPGTVLPKTSARLAFDLLVGTIDESRPVEVSYVQFFDMSGGEQLGLDLASSASTLTFSAHQQVFPSPDGGLPQDTPPNVLGAGQWTHIEVALSLQQQPAYILTIDDAGAGASLYPGFQGGQKAEICVGLSYFNTTSPVTPGTIHVDDLVFDVE